MADYAQVHLGGLQTPLTAATANSLLQDADPALYWFTQWCKGVLQIHLGPRWDAEVTVMGQSSLVGKIVQSTIPYDPVPLFQEAQFALPLLAIYRVDSDFNDATRTWVRRIGTWCVDYVLPPLSPAQMERMWPMTSAIEAVLYDRINHDADPYVLGGQTLKDLMQTEYIKVLQARPSRDWIKSNIQQTPGTANTVLFPLMHMRLEVAERALPVTYPAITGEDTAINVSNGTTSVNIANVSTDFPWGS